MYVSDLRVFVSKIRWSRRSPGLAGARVRRRAPRGPHHHRGVRRPPHRPFQRGLSRARSLRSTGLAERLAPSRASAAVMQEPRSVPAEDLDLCPERTVSLPRRPAATSGGSAFAAARFQSARVRGTWGSRPARRHPPSRTAPGSTRPGTRPPEEVPGAARSPGEGGSLAGSRRT